MRSAFRARGLVLLLSAGWIMDSVPWTAAAAGDSPEPDKGRALLRIRLSQGGRHFVRGEPGEQFRPWGFNYDHDDSGRLLEDYWTEEWPTVAQDFREMKELGANVVRIHLQLGRFMTTPAEPNESALGQLRRLLRLAETTGLYLDLTGLGCYHKSDIPEWYDALGEQERWQVQTRFWESVAAACASSPAVFCYDLMNEPILPGQDKKETDWLGTEFGGKYFVQRISRDLAGRTREEVAAAWVERLVAAIRKRDEKTLVTVGVIPWALVFPRAEPIFYSKKVAQHLDFVSVHFYPHRGEIDQALTALAVYEIGKPLVVEEVFPLRCGLDELDQFIRKSRGTVDGWIGFYWGRTPSEYKGEGATLAEALTRSWLEYFRAQAASGNLEPPTSKGE